jgi:hypothetical protein
LTMKLNVTTCMAPPFDTNPLTIMWCLVTTSHVLVCTFPKYVKLVEMAMVQIVSNVKDEHYFYMLAFMKSKFCNKLTTHAPCCLDVCKIVLHFAKFLVCRMYWTMANITTLLLLWWSRCAIFCEVVGHVFQRQEMLLMSLQRKILFGMCVCVFFVEFNGCITS